MDAAPEPVLKQIWRLPEEINLLATGLPDEETILGVSAGDLVHPKKSCILVLTQLRLVAVLEGGQVVPWPLRDSVAAFVEGRTGTSFLHVEGGGYKANIEMLMPWAKDFSELVQRSVARGKLAL